LTQPTVHQLLQQNVNRYAELTLTDGRKYMGNIVSVDHEKVALEVNSSTGNQDERFFPLITIPLAFIAGAAVGHHHYPYPYSYPAYPYSYSPYAYPYSPYYPYNYYR
jgi:hypothetical protein